MTRSDSAAGSVFDLETLFRGLLGRRLAVCVSGGPDSMALMHLVADWARLPAIHAAWRAVEVRRQVHKAQSPLTVPGPMRPTPVFPAGRLDGWAPTGAPAGDRLGEALGWPPVVVLTVDHRLRPGSASEAAFVAGEAAKLGFPHRTLVWDGQKPRTGVQQAARDARYGLMSELLDMECWAWRDAGDPVFGDPAVAPAASADHPLAAAKRILVTAHHLEDQAETFLMRLARGTTLDGLAGMRRLETFWVPPGGPERSYRAAYQVARPLLAVPKVALTGYLTGRGLAWRQDPTNSDTAYERVRIRNALPVLEGLGITAASIARTTERLEHTRENVRAQVADDVRDALVDECNGAFGRLLTRRMAGRPLDQCIRLLRYILAAYGGASAKPDYMQLERLADRLRRERPVHKLTLGGCILSPARAERDGAADDLLIWREPGRLGGSGGSVAGGHFVDWDGGRFRVSASPAAPPATIRPLGEDGWRLLRDAIPPELLRPGVRGAFQGLPGLWLADALAGVPSLDTAVPSSALDAVLGGARRLYNAEFRGHRLGLQSAGRWESLGGACKP